MFADVPPTRVVAVLNGGPPTRSGAGFAVAVAPKPSAANAAAFELVTVRLAASPPCSVITPPLTVDGVDGAGDRIDLCQQRLDAVGDVELVAGRARGDESDRRAVDGDGVAGREVRGQRIRSARRRTAASRR